MISPNRTAELYQFAGARLIGSNLTIFRKGLLLVGLPFALQLIFLGLLHLQAQSNEADRWAMHTKDVIALTKKPIGFWSRQLAECAAWS